MAVFRATFSVLLCGTLGLLFYFEAFQSLSEFRRSGRQLKSILIWNGFERIEISSFGTGHRPFVDNCSFSRDCFITSDRSSMNFGDFDAVVFNIPVLAAAGRPDRLPPPHWRRLHQRFVFFSQESPYYNNIDVDSFAGYFNWTMSFQRHCDIRFAYGSVERRPAGAAAGARWNLRAKKSKLVAALVSHCQTQSRRESYVAQLGEFIEIDTFGLCGTRNCSRDPEAGTSSAECYRLIERDYKFLLAFENSLCVDYVTEKLFSVLQYQIVPVVMGAANYSAVAPPRSYVNALDFTPRKLADHLHLLAANETLYNEFFEWKRRFRVRAGYRPMARQAFCSLCAKLHQDDRIRIHDDLRQHWSPRTQCTRPLHWKLLAAIDRFHDVDD